MKKIAGLLVLLLLAIFTFVPLILEAPPPLPRVVLAVVVAGAIVAVPASIIGAFWVSFVISANESLWTLTVHAFDKPPPSNSFPYDQDLYTQTPHNNDVNFDIRILRSVTGLYH